MFDNFRRLAALIALLFYSGPRKDCPCCYGSVPNRDEPCPLCPGR